jgi:SAM-dependent methyltransferase
MRNTETGSVGMIKNLIENGQVTPWRESYNDLVEFMAQATPNASVLDIGKSAQWHYDGLWKDYTVIDKESRSNPDILGDFFMYPLSSNTYNIILCFGMYEWVEDMEKMIKRIYRLLKPYGLAVFGFAGVDCDCEKPAGMSYKEQNIFGKFGQPQYFWSWEKAYYLAICQKPLLTAEQIEWLVANPRKADEFERIVKEEGILHG